MTLQEIKDQVAKEHGYHSWNDLHMNNFQLWPIICQRYATECVKASLERASECALVNIELRGGSESITVHKSSITDPKNIVVL